MEPIVRLGQRFQIPLESAGVDIERLPEAFHEMVLQQFISLSTMGYIKEFGGGSFMLQMLQSGLFDIGPPLYSHCRFQMASLREISLPLKSLKSIGDPC